MFETAFVGAVTGLEGVFQDSAPEGVPERRDLLLASISRKITVGLHFHNHLVSPIISAGFCGFLDIPWRRAS